MGAILPLEWTGTAEKEKGFANPMVMITFRNVNRPDVCFCARVCAPQQRRAPLVCILLSRV